MPTRILSALNALGKNKTVNSRVEESPDWPDDLITENRNFVLITDNTQRHCHHYRVILHLTYRTFSFVQALVHHNTPYTHIHRHSMPARSRPWIHSKLLECYFYGTRSVHADVSIAKPDTTVFTGVKSDRRDRQTGAMSIRLQLWKYYPHITDVNWCGEMKSWHQLALRLALIHNTHSDLRRQTSISYQQIHGYNTAGCICY